MMPMPSAISPCEPSLTAGFSAGRMGRIRVGYGREPVPHECGIEERASNDVADPRRFRGRREHRPFLKEHDLEIALLRKPAGDHTSGRAATNDQIVNHASLGMTHAVERPGLIRGNTFSA